MTKEELQDILESSIYEYCKVNKRTIEEIDVDTYWIDKYEPEVWVTVHDFPLPEGESIIPEKV